MMNPNQTRSSDRITVLVFKDHLASRTFHLSLKGLTQLCGFLFILTFLAFLTPLLAYKYYRTQLKLTQLRTEGPSPVGLFPASSNQKDASISPLPHPTSPQPGLMNGGGTSRGAELSSHSQEPPHEALSSGSSHPFMTSLSSSELPYTTQIFSAHHLSAPPPLERLAFAVENPKFTWKERSLQVRFALHYTKGDQDSQQGRILLLARSNQGLRTYPDGVLTPSGSATLLTPEKGEFFSVSRFREVKAEFGPLSARETLFNIEVFLFNSEGGLLYYQSHTPDARPRLESRPAKNPEALTSSPAAPSAPPSETKKDEHSATPPHGP
jgi:hypothetical protein